MNNSLSKSFISSIGHEATGIAENFLEIGLDVLSNEGIIRDIPFVSTVASLFHIGQSISDWNNLRKLAAFIEQINQSLCSETELEEHRKRFVFCSLNQPKSYFSTDISDTPQAGNSQRTSSLSLLGYAKEQAECANRRVHHHSRAGHQQAKILKQTVFALGFCW